MQRVMKKRKKNLKKIQRNSKKNLKIFQGLGLV